MLFAARRRVDDLKEICSVSAPAAKAQHTRLDIHSRRLCQNLGVVQCDKDTNMIAYYMTPQEPEENYASARLSSSDTPEKVMTNQGCCTPKPWALSMDFISRSFLIQIQRRQAKLASTLRGLLHQINGSEYVFLVALQKWSLK